MSSLSEEFIRQAILNPLMDEKCSQLHPGVSCNLKMCLQFAATCKSLYKMYLLVHLIPFLIFKRKKLMKEPLQESKKLLKGYLRSLGFIFYCCTAAKYGWCLMQRTDNMVLKSELGI